MAAEHLLALGHRRIAFVGDEEENLFGFDSERAPARGLRGGAGRRRSAARARVDRAPAARPRRRAATRRPSCSRSDPRPTAVFASSDVQAIGVLEAAQAAGVAGARASSRSSASTTWRPRAYTGLTTVAQPLEESGALGADLLLRALAGEAVESRRMPLAIVERGSTAAPGLAGGA